mgnify:CR=1 FL=1
MDPHITCSIPWHFKLGRLRINTSFYQKAYQYAQVGSAHEGKKPFTKCTDGNAAFSQKGNLNKHFRISS